MQVAHAEDSAKITSIRGAEREFKTLLTGEEGALDNFRLYFVRQIGAVDIPRHKHNFDQIRMCLEGGRQNFGAHKWIAPGELAYFPEGTPYGPEQSDNERLSLTFQFGGASRSGFIGSARLHQAMEELKAFGTFEKGIFTRSGDLAPGQKRNQDSFEAIWEQVNKRKLDYPRARYGEPILIKPANFEWDALEEGDVARKVLGSFAGGLRLSVFKVEANTQGRLSSGGSIRIGFVLQGSGTVNGYEIRKYSAFSGREDLSLSARNTLEILLVELPVFAKQTSTKTLVAAE